MNEELGTILVVDDDRFMREALKMTLGPRYSYGFADSVYKAEKELTCRTYDLVLLDLHMPGGSGINLLPTIRQKCPDTDVVIITAFGSYEAALDAIRHKVAGFLEKDFSPIELQILVSDTIRQRRQQRLLQSLQDQLGEERGLEKGALEHLRGAETRDRKVPAPPSDLTFFRTLSSVLESQDYVTAGHSIRVSRYAVAVARLLGLDEEAVAEVELASYVHDLGKVGVNKSVLNKEGQLSRLDWVEIKRHPAMGARILRPLGFSANVLDGVRYHHERLDGSGYPEGISGEAIGVTPRLIGVVDSFDAMTWPRLYRKIPIAPLAALEILYKEAPTKYAPEMVTALQQALECGTIRMDTSCDPIRSRCRADLDREEDHRSTGCGVDDEDPDGKSAASAGPLPYTTSGKRREDEALPEEGGLPGENMSEDLLENEGVMRTRFAPLGDLYADPHDLDKMVVQVRRLPSGETYCLIPGEGGPEEIALLFGNLIRFYHLVADNGLRPFYARPGTLTVSPDLHLSHGHAVPGHPAMQEYSDGEKVYIADLKREDACGPITYSLRSGRINRTVERVELRAEHLLHAMREQGVEEGGANPVWAMVSDWLLQKKALLQGTPGYLRQLTQVPWVEYHALSNKLCGDLQHAVQGLATEIPAATDTATCLNLLSCLQEPGALKVTFAVEAVEGEVDLFERVKGQLLCELPVYSREMNDLLDAVRALATSGNGQEPTIADLLPGVDSVVHATPLQRLEYFKALAPLLFQLQNCLWGYDRTFEALVLGAVIRKLDHIYQDLAAEGASGDHLLYLKLKMFPLITPRARHQLRDLLVQHGGDAPLHRIMASGLSEPTVQLRRAVQDIASISDALNNPLAARAARYLQRALTVLEDQGLGKTGKDLIVVPMEVNCLLLAGMENLRLLQSLPPAYVQLLVQCAVAAGFPEDHEITLGELYSALAVLELSRRNRVTAVLQGTRGADQDVAAASRVLWTVLLGCWGRVLRGQRRRDLTQREGRVVFDIEYRPMFNPDMVCLPGKERMKSRLDPPARGPLVETRAFELPGQYRSDFHRFRAGFMTSSKQTPSFSPADERGHDLLPLVFSSTVQVRATPCRQLLLFSQTFGGTMVTVDLQLEQGELTAYAEAYLGQDGSRIADETAIDTNGGDCSRYKALRDTSDAPIFWFKTEIMDAPRPGSSGDAKRGS